MRPRFDNPIEVFLYFWKCQEPERIEKASGPVRHLGGPAMPDLLQALAAGSPSSTYDELLQGHPYSQQAMAAVFRPPRIQLRVSTQLPLVGPWLCAQPFPCGFQWHPPTTLYGGNHYLHLAEKQVACPRCWLSINESGGLAKIKNGKVSFKGLRICKSKTLPGNTQMFWRKKKSWEFLQ